MANQAPRLALTLKKRTEGRDRVGSLVLQDREPGLWYHQGTSSAEGRLPTGHRLGAPQVVPHLSVPGRGRGAVCWARDRGRKNESVLVPWADPECRGPLEEAGFHSL